MLSSYLKKIYILFPAFLFTQILFAQNKLDGKVININDEPIIGANIWSKQLRNGTVTNLQGDFEIEVRYPDTLLISHLGYHTEAIVVTKQMDLKVILEENMELLEEVVVVGYGTQRRKDITGASTSVSQKNFNQGIINSPEQLVNGKVSGVEFIQNDGEPGAAFTVRIRGAATIRAGNDPLYVIDGYPVDINNPGLANSGSTRFSPKNALEFLNPQDIASIDILKDASAAAIYGARGANGVILITTKKGAIGKPRFSYSTYVGMSQLRKKVDVLSPQEFRNAVNEFGLVANDFGSETDWQDEVFQTALIHNHNISLNGGTQNNRYRVSLNYHNQDGIIRTTQYSKYNARLHLNQSALNNRLQISFNLTAALIRDRRAPPGIVISILERNPTWPIMDGDGNFFQPFPSSSFEHAIARVENYNNTVSTTRTLSNLSAALEIVKGLEYKINLGGDFSNATGRNYRTSLIPTERSAAISNRELSSYIIEHYLTYKKQFGWYHFTGLAGYSFQEFRNAGSLLARFNFATDDIPLVNNINAGQELQENLSWKEKNALQSVFARVHLDFKNKYLLTANFRADGSSRFGANNKYGYFPSIAVAWRLSEERFFQKSKFLDDLKFRASWGVTGNQEIPNKISQPLYGTPTNAQAILGETGQPTIGYAFLRTANPDLQWEETKQYNFGIDASFSRGRWNFNVDYFQKRTSNFLLFTQAASAPTPNIWTNLDGEILNKGWEMAINGHLLQKRKLKWETGLTFTKINNSASGLPNIIGVGQVFGFGQAGVIPQVIKNDAPIGTFFGRRWLGFDENGNNIFKKDEDGKDEFETIGNALPDFTMGWWNSFHFKNWELTFLINGSYGQEIFNNLFLASISKQSFQAGNNTTSDLLFSNENFFNNLTYSSRYLENGSFIRLSQLTINYQFAVEDISWLNQLEMYVVGNNLFLWTKYKGYDPEVNIPIQNDNAIPSQGVDWDAIPRPLSLQLGLKISFL